MGFLFEVAASGVVHSVVVEFDVVADIDKGLVAQAIAQAESVVVG